MSDETIEKFQSLTDNFIKKTGLKEFNTESFIDSIKYMVDHLSWERDDVYERYTGNFFSLYEQGLVSDVMPAIVNGIQKGSSAGIDAGGIYNEYNQLMKHVMAETAPRKVIEAAFGGEVDVDEFRENPDMNLNAFDVSNTVFDVESRMNKLELAILNTPAYKRIVQMDEELQKKNPQLKKTIITIMQIR